MLFVLNFVLITLTSVTANNVSSKPSDNKVSSSLYRVLGKIKRKTRKKKDENIANDVIADNHNLFLK